MKTNLVKDEKQNRIIYSKRAKYEGHSSYYV